jgi:hypothetical protein
VLVAAWDFLLTALGAPPASEANDVQGGSFADTLLSGAVVGGVIVFVLTVVYREWVRIGQQGTLLRGLARVIHPEMKRNVKALEYLQKYARERNALTRADYQREHPIDDAWRDARTRLAEVMPRQDFAVLASFYEELELLTHSAERGEWDEGVEAGARIQLRVSAKQIMDAMRVVDGYCVAEWSWRLWSWCPGPIDQTRPTAES